MHICEKTLENSIWKVQLMSIKTAVQPNTELSPSNTAFQNFLANKRLTFMTTCK